MKLRTSQKAQSVCSSAERTPTDRRATTPTQSSQGQGYPSPNRPPSHRVIELHSVDSSAARLKRIQDHYGRQPIPVAEPTPRRSLYRDEFLPKTTVISPAFYPKHNLHVDKAAKGYYVPTAKETQFVPTHTVRHVSGHSYQPHLQSSRVLAELTGGKFEGRTEKQDQFWNYSVVLK